MDIEFELHRHYYLGFLSIIILYPAQRLQAVVFDLVFSQWYAHSAGFHSFLGVSGIGRPNAANARRPIPFGVLADPERQSARIPMTEYLTQAVVLGLRPHKESDRVVDLYTRDFGRLESNVVGGRGFFQTLPHLNLFNVIIVRLAEKNRAILTDALTDESFRKNRRDPKFYPSAFRIISLCGLTPKGVPDLRLWHLIVKGLASADGDVKVFSRRSATIRRRRSAIFAREDLLFPCEKTSHFLPELRFKNKE